MEYSDVIAFAESWGLVYLFVLFLCAVVYALWPGNKDKFARGARIPFEEDGP